MILAQNTRVVGRQLELTPDMPKVSALLTATCSAGPGGKALCQRSGELKVCVVIQKAVTSILRIDYFLFYLSRNLIVTYGLY